MYNTSLLSRKTIIIFFFLNFFLFLNMLQVTIIAVPYIKTLVVEMVFN